MKAYFKFFLATLAAAAALASCTKEITPPNFENDKVNPAAEGSRVITVSFAPQTKTALDGFQPKFADGDSILLCAAPEDEDSDIKTDICRVDVDDEGNATITTNLTGCLGALYPAKFVKSDEGELDIIIPSVQSGKFSDANICRAVMEGEDDTSLHFENECSILKFYVDESIGVKSIEIINSGWDDIASGSRTITVEAPEDKTLYDVMPSEGQDRRICYVALDCAKDRVRANELTFKTETTTQGPVTRIPTESSYLQVGYMYNVFLPYYIEVNGQKWAYCNVGAFLPEEPGLYFAWGDTEGQNWNGSAWSGSGFFWANAPFNGGASTYDETYFLSQKSTVCPDYILAQEYDAAYKNWGEGWRMPTYSEFETMYNATYFGWDDTDKGCYVYVPNPISDAGKCSEGEGSYTKSDALLFFPAAGGGTGEGLNYKGSRGYYRASSLFYDHKGYAEYLYFKKDFHNIYPQDPYYRCSGLSIRPIYAGPAPAPEKPASLSGVFTVDSNGKKVKFTKGNLYWDGSSYQFENNQYDYRHYNGKSGDAAVINGVATTTPSGTVGSFWWISKDEVGCKPYDETYTQTLTSGEYYFFTEEPNGIAGQSKANVNFAVNGESGKYHVLKENDWIYLLRLSSFGRSSDWNLFAKAKVHDVNGLLIFPDEYSLPSGYTKNEGGTGMAVINGKAEKFPENSIPDDVWSSMESDGVVFLPAAGYRTATNIQQVGNFGHYLTSFASSSGTTKLFISGTDTNKDVNCSGKASCGSGNLIRLVSEVKDN